MSTTTPSQQPLLKNYIPLRAYPQDYSKTLPLGQQITETAPKKELQDTIVVYQAYKTSIAQYAVQHQQFLGCEEFSPTRMTWIKPNFLWMMYRSSWSTAKNQERVLAIVISKSVFEQDILAHAVPSGYHSDKSIFASEKEYKKALEKSDIRLQWDPHHTPSGGKVGMSRAIQLGLRKCTEFAKNVSNGGWIVRIDDISEFCHEQKQRMDEGQEFFIPCETFYQVSNVMTCSRIELS